MIKKAGTIEYKMSPLMARMLLKTRKGTDKNMKPNDYLVKYVNEELNLKGTCVKVLTDL